MFQRLLLVAMIAGPAHGSTIARWTFEEGSPGVVAAGAASIIDSANGLNGTPAGGPLYTSVIGPGGPVGLQFDGLNDSVLIPDNALLAITSSITIEAIVRIDGIAPTGDYNQVVFRGDSRGGLDPYFLAIRSTGHLQFSVGAENQTSANAISPAPLPFGRTLHIAGSLDDSTGLLSVYVNGVQVASLTTQIRPFATLSSAHNPGVSIGSIQSGGQHLYGVINDVRISDAALSPTEFLPIPCIGDLNGDAATNSFDFNILAGWFGQSVPPHTGADLNGDGVVDALDFNMLAGNFGCIAD